MLFLIMFTLTLLIIGNAMNYANVAVATPLVVASVVPAHMYTEISRGGYRR